MTLTHKTTHTTTLPPQRNYQYHPPSTPGAAREREQAQRALSQQEELFLHFLPPEEAAVAAHAMQREWRVQFLGFAQGKGQPLANLPAWGDTLREQLGEAAADVMLRGPPPMAMAAATAMAVEEGAAGSAPAPLPVLHPAHPHRHHQEEAAPAASLLPRPLPTLVVAPGEPQQHQQQQPRPAKRPAPAPCATSPIPARMAPPARQQQQPGGGGGGASSSAAAPGWSMRGLAPLLVRMSADRRRDYTVARGVLGATSIEDLLSLLRAGPPHELALLARASSGAILFASAGLQRALGRDDADLLGSVLFGPADASPGSGGGLIHPDDAVVLQLAFRESQRRVRRLLERARHGPLPPLGEQDVAGAPLVLRLRRGGRGAPTARELGGTFIDIDAAFAARHHLTAFATEDFFLLHAPGPRVHHQPADVGPAAAAVEAGIRSMDLGVSTPSSSSSSSSAGARWQRSPPAQGRQAQQQGQGQGRQYVVQPASLRYPQQVTALQAMAGPPPPPPPGTMTARLGGGGGEGMVVLPPPAVPHCPPRQQRQRSQQQPPRESPLMPAMGGRGPIPAPLPPLQPQQPRVEEVGPDGRPLVGAGGEDALGWEGEALEWCDDEDLSLALQHLGSGGGGDEASGGAQATATATAAAASSAMVPVAGGGSVFTPSTAPSSPSLQDAWGGAYDLCYAPPTSFEQTMRAFLQGLPFEVRGWVGGSWGLWRSGPINSPPSVLTDHSTRTHPPAQNRLWTSGCPYGTRPRAGSPSSSAGGSRSAPRSRSGSSTPATLPSTRGRCVRGVGFGCVWLFGVSR